MQRASPMLGRAEPWSAERSPPLTAGDAARRGLLSRLPGPVLLALVTAVYLALAQYVILLNDPVQLGAGFWPAAGVSLGLLTMLPVHRWPWVLGGVALAEVGGDLVHGYPVGAIALWTIGNVVEPLVGAALIRRFAPHRGDLRPVAGFAGFLAFGVVAGPLVGASVGSLGTILGYGSAATVVWPKYVVGDALGVLVVAPLLLTWTERWTSRSRLEAVALVVSSIAVTMVVFQNWDVVWDITLPYLIVPFLMWAGLRFGLRGVALVGFAIANIANWATAIGYGPFAIAGGTEHGVTLLQLFLGISLTSAFLLASLASDLTDSKAMARRQAEHTAEIERSREFRDAFVGVLSHEIRTPITTIYGMSQLLRKRHASMDPEKVARYLDDIGTESERLRRLTEDLLVLSRAQGGRLELAANPILMGHLVRTTIASERARYPGRDIDLDAPSGGPLVLGEDVYVEQVLRNYVNNAAKYSDPSAAIRVTVTAEAGGVAVRVIDSGPGLPDGPPERLFEVFYRATGAISSTAGAGIGLFVCQQLIGAMGGRVWATNAADGTGAEFGFWLPESTDDIEEH